MSVPTEEEVEQVLDALAGEEPESPERRQAIRIVVNALELALEKGRIKPWEALATGKELGIPLPGWIQKKHDYYTKTLEGRAP